jgi:hypothetical protein
MPTLLQTVSESILAPGGLSIDDLEPLVGELSVGDVDFADLFLSVLRPRLIRSKMAR